MSNAVPKINIRGIRQSMPSGYFLGRTDKGNGPPHLIKLQAVAAAVAALPVLRCGGDLSGPVANATVIGLQGRSVKNTAPSAGNVLTWSAADSAWEPQAGGSANDPSIVPLITPPANPGFDVRMASTVITPIAFSNSNKTATPSSSSPYNYLYGSSAHYTGKWYWEAQFGNVGFSAIGVCGPGGRIFETGTSTTFFGNGFSGQVGWSSGGSVNVLAPTSDRKSVV